MRAIWRRSAGGQTNNCSSGRTAEHACLLDNQLGISSCREGAWCQKGQYKYTVNSTCAAPNFGAQQGTENACAEYVIAATPLIRAQGYTILFGVDASSGRVRADPY